MYIVCLSFKVSAVCVSSIQLEHYTVGTKPFHGTWLNIDMIQGHINLQHSVTKNPEKYDVITNTHVPVFTYRRC